MSFKYITPFLLPLLFSLSYHANSQGCSDAGFCTMGAMKPNQSFKKFKAKVVSVELGQYYGYTKFQTHVFVSYVDVNVGLGTKTSVQVKVPYLFVKGELGSANSFSDISYSLTRNVVRKDKYQINVTVGGKIPTNNGNLPSNIYDHKVMPMYYQTSLGTYDIVFGASMLTKKWLFAAGYQQPLNSNKNTFSHQLWTGEDPAATEYPNTISLKRGNDIMIRVERNFRSSRFNGYVGLLPIWRLNKDVATDPITGARVQLQGSSGIALNGLGGVGYNLSARSTLKFLGAYAIRSRPHNPDGLSRIFVTTISYEVRF